jgi:hypothetical protein
MDQVTGAMPRPALQYETIEGHGGGIAWLATHPPTAQRLAHAAQSTAGAPPLSDEEWAAVRGMCR